MAVAVNDSYTFTTGVTRLPDIGVLAYNGCTFSPLFETKISGKVVKDNANRTTKYMEYTITADGYVTLPNDAATIGPAMTLLRSLLTVQGGSLVYTGRGFDLIVNQQIDNPDALPNFKPGPALSGNDVAWGPVPELIEFQPLGAGRSAKVQWKCTVRIPESVARGTPLLQLNYETSVGYGEDGFSTLGIRGTLEVPMTRSSVRSRVVPYTVDKYRTLLEKNIIGGIDLDRFRVTRREFNVSRDKRTLEWDVAAEELPYMQMPPDCTVARGTYTVRPAKVGQGLVSWLCTLKATYTVRTGAWRRTAWLAFLALLRKRMSASRTGSSPKVKEKKAPRRPGILKLLGRGLVGAGIGLVGSGFNPFVGFGAATVAVVTAPDEPGEDGIEKAGRHVWLIDFTAEEGLYLDSKTVTFSATWRLLTDFSHILLASGLWRKVPELGGRGFVAAAQGRGQPKSLWATSMRNISGASSWLRNELDPKLDIIVDFGGPDAI